MTKPPRHSSCAPHFASRHDPQKSVTPHRNTRRLPVSFPNASRWGNVARAGRLPTGHRKPDDENENRDAQSQPNPVAQTTLPHQSSSSPHLASRVELRAARPRGRRVKEPPKQRVQNPYRSGNHDRKRRQSHDNEPHLYVYVPLRPGVVRPLLRPFRIVARRRSSPSARKIRPPIASAVRSGRRRVRDRLRSRARPRAALGVDRPADRSATALPPAGAARQACKLPHPDSRDELVGLRSATRLRIQRGRTQQGGRLSPCPDEPASDRANRAGRRSELANARGE
jgi:hypothetical protein